MDWAIDKLVTSVQLVSGFPATTSEPEAAFNSRQNKDLLSVLHHVWPIYNISHVPPITAKAGTIEALQRILSSDTMSVSIRELEKYSIHTYFQRVSSHTSFYRAHGSVDEVQRSRREARTGDGT